MKRYKLSDKVIARLVNPRTGKEVKTDIEMLLGCSPQSVNSWVRYNELDGPLTREAVLQIIEKKFAISRGEILHVITV